MYNTSIKCKSNVAIFNGIAILFTSGSKSRIGIQFRRKGRTMPITNRRNTKKKAALEAVSEFNSDAMDEEKRGSQPRQQTKKTEGYLWGSLLSGWGADNITDNTARNGRRLIAKDAYLYVSFRRRLNGVIRVTAIGNGLRVMRRGDATTASACAEHVHSNGLFRYRKRSLIFSFHGCNVLFVYFVCLFTD